MSSGYVGDEGERRKVPHYPGDATHVSWCRQCKERARDHHRKPYVDRRAAPDPSEFADTCLPREGYHAEGCVCRRLEKGA